MKLGFRRLCHKDQVYLKRVTRGILASLAMWQNQPIQLIFKALLLTLVMVGSQSLGSFPGSAGRSLVWSQQVSAIQLDGTKEQFTIQSIAEKGAITKNDNSTISLDEFRELRTQSSLLGDDPTTTIVNLRKGGVLNVREITMTDGRLRFATDLADILYPITDVASIIYQRVTAEAELKTMLEQPSSETDRLLVSTSKGPRTVSGLVEAISKTEVTIYYEDQSRNVSLDRVIAIVPAKLESSQPVKYLVTTIDRSRMIADSLTADQGKWTIGWGKQKTTLPMEQVYWVEIKSDRVLYVSDLEAELDQLETILAPKQVNQRDKSVVGTSLKLRITATTDEVAIREFSKGLGTHARSRMIFNLPPEFTKLSGYVGIDEATDGHGDCRCSILLDGIQVFSADLKGGQPAVAFNLELQSAAKLELLVEPGPLLDLSDWVDWADIRLLK